MGLFFINPHLKRGPYFSFFDGAGGCWGASTKKLCVQGLARLLFLLPPAVSLCPRHAEVEMGFDGQCARASDGRQ